MSENKGKFRYEEDCTLNNCMYRKFGLARGGNGECLELRATLGA